MRIVVTTAGSHGDVAPYTGLAARLNAGGHHAVVATHEPFRQFVESRGIEFAPLPGDPRELLESDDGQRWQRAGTGPGAALHLIRILRPYGREMAERTFAATEGADLLLCSALTAASYHIAHGRGIPSMGVYLQPLEPTREFPTVLAGGVRSMGGWGNVASGRLAEALVGLPFMAEVNRGRRELGLPEQTYRQLRRELRNERWPILHGFSRHVVPRPHDWRDGLDVVGYWWPEPDPSWTPSTRLVDFLAAGDPPVFFGFGSMAAGTGEAERLAALATEALRAVGARGVVQAGWSGLTARGDDLLSICETPHEWLFPRMAALVHHAGAGTSAAGVRAGIPGVPVPVLADQPFWASRFSRLGVATPPIPFAQLTSERLAAALRQVLANPANGVRARALAQQVKREDGAARVLDAVNRL
jgi:UDP:flavonoid glycosyltransferase YjiC (YdhE family)